MLRRLFTWLDATPAILAGILILLLAQPSLGDEPQPELDVPYEPTHPTVVAAMLELAGVQPGDIVYDLGCGDGRIVIAAAQKFKARGVGIDIDPQRIKEATANAEAAGVSDLVEFRMGDIMGYDLSEATVVTLYLLNHVNLMIRPKLFADLKPGTRVVSHAFHMDDWESDKTMKVPRARNQIVFLWVIPAKIGGDWRWESPAPEGNSPWVARLFQEFQGARGNLMLPEQEKARINSVSVSGRELELNVTVPNDQGEVRVVYRGAVQGDTVEGTETRLLPGGDQEHPWRATREPANIVGSWQIAVESPKENLNGILYVDPLNEALSARYSFTNESRDVLTAFYHWGTSVRFEIVSGEEIYVLSGTLQGNEGSGGLMTAGLGTQVNWSAKRIAQDPEKESEVQPQV